MRSRFHNHTETPFYQLTKLCNLLRVSFLTAWVRPAATNSKPGLRCCTQGPIPPGGHTCQRTCARISSQALAWRHASGLSVGCHGATGACDSACRDHALVRQLVRAHAHRRNVRGRCEIRAHTQGFLAQFASRCVAYQQVRAKVPCNTPARVYQSLRAAALSDRDATRRTHLQRYNAAALSE